MKTRLSDRRTHGVSSHVLGAPVLRWTGLAILIITAAIATGLTASYLSGPVEASGPVQDRTASKKTIDDANYDIRMMGGGTVERLTATRGVAGSDVVQAGREQVRSISTGVMKLKAARPTAKVDLSPVTAAVEIVDGGGAALSRPNRGQPGEFIVRSFLEANRELYGLEPTDIANLHFIGESVSPSGVRMVRVEQQIGGAPIFQSETRFILDREGRVIKSLGAMIPSPPAVSNYARLSPQEALRVTMGQLKVDLDVARMSIVGEKDGGLVEMRVDDPRIAGKVTSRLVYFPIAPGVLVPAYSQVVWGEKNDWYVLVDANDGTMLWRKNIRNDASTHNARFRVFVQADGTTPADSPAPQSPSGAAVGAGTQFGGIAPTIVSMFLAQNLTASPNGWIDDCPAGVCTTNETQTAGNNVLSCVDRVSGVGETNVCDIGALDANGQPVGNPDANGRNRDFLGTAPRDFETAFLPAPQGGNANAGQSPTGVGAAQDQFRRASVAQQFYNANWYHDKLHALGFNQAAGNFQNDNFGGGGVGGDRVLIDVQDASGQNNANFGTPPDGQSGRAQMFRFTGPNPDRDGGLDAEILFHELTHGTSNRLIGNANGLIWSVGRGLGEGWSDFYALSLLNNTNGDDPNGSYASGAYATYQLGGLTDNYVYGIRRFPISTNNSVNPLTWADVDDVTNNLSGGIAPSPLDFNGQGGMEVHNIGELWTVSLWEVRSRIIAANGGSVPTGNQKTLQIVTDAMKMTPSNPSFIQARDAVIAADCVANACANEQSIWEGFTDRGLGYNAVAPLGQMGFGNLGHMAVGESFSLPNLDTNGITVNDTTGNNNGAIDPNEPVRITVNLKNPWRNGAKGVGSATATLTTTTPGVVITDNSSAYPAIGANGSANGDTFAFTVPNAAACGQSLKFSLQISSSLGSVTREFSLRVGTPAGTSAPVTFTRSSVGLGIPDGAPRGVSDAMTITDDLEIADLNYRIDNLSHTFTGDITAMLRGPNGYGADGIWLREILFGGGDGDNFINTVIDDQAAGDLNQTLASEAPYTGSFKPAFNSPVWTLFGDPSVFPDAVGQLSRFNGMSTQGQWRMHVSDNFNLDSGTLNSWSIIVTPRAFACTAYVANQPPVFTPVLPVVRQQGTDASQTAVTVGTVSDPDTNAGLLTVTQIPGGSATGITLFGLTNTDGTVTAAVTASCTATSGTVRFEVSDGTNTVTGNLAVVVLPNAAPTLTYLPSYSVANGGNITITPTALSDNGSIANVELVSSGLLAGSFITDPATGVITITGAENIGGHTLTVRATDNCGAQKVAIFSVVVTNNQPTIAPAAAATRQRGSAGTAVTIATVGDLDQSAGSLMVTSTAGAPGIAVSNITNNNGTISANIAADCFAALGANTVSFTVSDSNGGSAIANFTVNVTANTPPVLTYGSWASPLGTSPTVSPLTGPTDNGLLPTIALLSQGTYTGGISVNNGTGVVSFAAAAPVGTHTITVRATDNCSLATDATFSLVVGPANTNIAITSDTPDASVAGQPVLVSFALNPATNIAQPTGSVLVTAAGGDETCTAAVNPLTAAGSCSLTLTSVGSRTITAQYQGDSNFNSSSDGDAHTVNQAATATTITNAVTLAGGPTLVGQAYPVNVAVNPVAPGAGAPTGLVTVSNGTASCTVNLVTVNNGSGSCLLTSTTPGNKTITASYAGDTNFTASASSAAAHPVIIAIGGNVKQFVQNGSNTNLAGVTVAMALNGVPTTTAVTDASGNYSFGLLVNNANVVLTPSGFGKTYEAISRTYNNVTDNIAGANFVAYDANGPNANAREVKAVNTVGTPGQSVTVPVSINSQGNETSVGFTLAFDPAKMSVPASVVCGAGFVGCTVAPFETGTPGRVGVVVNRTAAFAAGVREVVRLTFPTTAAAIGSSPVTFADAPTVRSTINGDGNPVPTLYTAGFVSFTPDLEGDIVGANGAFPGGDGVLANDVALIRQMALGLIQPTAAQYRYADTAPRSTLGDGCPINSADVTQAARYNLGLDAPATAGGPASALPGGCAPPHAAG